MLDGFHPEPVRHLAGSIHSHQGPVTVGFNHRSLIGGGERLVNRNRGTFQASVPDPSSIGQFTIQRAGVRIPQKHNQPLGSQNELQVAGRWDKQFVLLVPLQVESWRRVEWQERNGIGGGTANTTRCVLLPSRESNNHLADV